ncbi:MAG: aminomethyl-transferring glycine dehydrogenase subunit GcvPB [Anaeromicrobium sp.]|jgi:glycine dehydrogenase subunit 2|uniref:aminomethyl-transferring glycine dehydrogenase subunit GcvPB n=1 Tax=Anaeromicrobium sp. TaxID=1929132 RepID=UPI0025CCBB6F|nr:aminomethyl-transferring glycine dehydrogenase subunit GcvPB [Anaeromicrobium sp.]MCT4595449.1 aminomethyl-transferring glycine dehydrogenase subunit GcvPB [Anaeromicrobium sp.]
MKRIDRNYKVRNFHQAKWDEPIIYELSKKGERGILVPEVSDEIKDRVGECTSKLPKGMLRKEPVNLPEISQSRVLRHYMRLSQQTLGADVNIEIGQGTCTVKYSPKINEQFARMPQITELHPLQDESTVQGMLEIIHSTDEYMREISGMSRFTFQPGGGSQGILAMASIIRKYHEDKGNHKTKDEIITTIYSHPSDAAAPAVKGYKIIYIHPDENGYPDFEAFRAAVNERTAGFIVANPEDTGVYNPRVKEFTSLVHEYDGLCGYDQANANGLLGVTRAKEAGFDMCFFNLHKTFSTPHGCGGPASGATGVVEKLVKYLPGPLVEKSEGKYKLSYDLLDEEYSIGKVRMFLGVAPVILKAYSWIRSLGAEGLYEVAKIAVLNNNYLFSKLMNIDCVDAPYIRGKQRIEQVRYTIEKLTKDTGVTTGDIQRRMMDFGMHYWTSHHPYHIPEPITLEPTETPSKEDLDEYIATLEHIFKECYENPEIVKTAPHSSVCHQVDESSLDDPSEWALSWRTYLRKTSNE